LLPDSDGNINYIPVAWCFRETVDILTMLAVSIAVAPLAPSDAPLPGWRRRLWHSRFSEAAPELLNWAVSYLPRRCRSGNLASNAMQLLFGSGVEVVTGPALPCTMLLGMGTTAETAGSDWKRWRDAFFGCQDRENLQELARGVVPFFPHLRDLLIAFDNFLSLWSVKLLRRDHYARLVLQGSGSHELPPFFAVMECPHCHRMDSLFGLVAARNGDNFLYSEIGTGHLLDVPIDLTFKRRFFAQISRRASAARENMFSVAAEAPDEPAASVTADDNGSEELVQDNCDKLMSIVGERVFAQYYWPILAVVSEADGRLPLELLADPSLGCCDGEVLLKHLIGLLDCPGTDVSCAPGVSLARLQAITRKRVVDTCAQLAYWAEDRVTNGGGHDRLDRLAITNLARWVVKSQEKGLAARLLSNSRATDCILDWLQRHSDRGQHLSKVLQVSEDWLKLWGDRAEFRRQIIRLRLMRVECHRRLENTSAAREELDSIIAITEDSSKDMLLPRAQAFCSRAKLDMDLGNVSSAGDDAALAVEIISPLLSNDSPEALEVFLNGVWLQANAMLALESVPQAIAALHRAVWAKLEPARKSERMILAKINYLLAKLQSGERGGNIWAIRSEYLSVLSLMGEKPSASDETALEMWAISKYGVLRYSEEDPETEKLAEAKTLLQELVASEAKAEWLTALSWVCGCLVSSGEKELYLRRADKNSGDSQDEPQSATADAERDERAAKASGMPAEEQPSELTADGKELETPAAGEAETADAEGTASDESEIASDSATESEASDDKTAVGEDSGAGEALPSVQADTDAEAAAGELDASSEAVCPEGREEIDREALAAVLAEIDDAIAVSEKLSELEPTEQHRCALAALWEKRAQLHSGVDIQLELDGLNRAWTVYRDLLDDGCNGVKDHFVQLWTDRSLLQMQTDRQEALRELQAISAYWEQLPEDERARVCYVEAFSGLAGLHHENGDYQQGMASLDRAIDVLRACRTNEQAKGAADTRSSKLSGIALAARLAQLLQRRCWHLYRHALWEQAVSDMAELIELSHDAEETRLLCLAKALCHMRAEQFEEAHKLFEVLHQNGDPLGTVGAGWAIFGQKDFAQAVHYFRDALDGQKLDEKNNGLALLWARWGIAEVYAFNDNAAQAERERLHAVSVWQSCERQISAGSGASPWHSETDVLSWELADILLKSAQVLLADAQYAEAKKALQEARALFWTDGYIPAECSARHLLASLLSIKISALSGEADQALQLGLEWLESEAAASADDELSAWVSLFCARRLSESEEFTPAIVEKLDIIVSVLQRYSAKDEQFGVVYCGMVSALRSWVCAELDEQADVRQALDKAEKELYSRRKHSGGNAYSWEISFVYAVQLLLALREGRTSKGALMLNCLADVLQKPGTSLPLLKWCPAATRRILIDILAKQFQTTVEIASAWAKLLACPVWEAADLDTVEDIYSRQYLPVTSGRYWKELSATAEAIMRHAEAVKRTGCSKLLTVWWQRTQELCADDNDEGMFSLLALCELILANIDSPCWPEGCTWQAYTLLLECLNRIDKKAEVLAWMGRAPAFISRDCSANERGLRLTQIELERALLLYEVDRINEAVTAVEDAEAIVEETFEDNPPAELSEQIAEVRKLLDSEGNYTGAVSAFSGILNRSEAKGLGAGPAEEASEAAASDNGDGAAAKALDADASAGLAESAADTEPSGTPAAGDASFGVSETVTDAELSGASDAGDASAGLAESAADAEPSGVSAVADASAGVTRVITYAEFTDASDAVDASADIAESAADAEPSGASDAGDASADASEPVTEAELYGAPAAVDASADIAESAADAEPFGASDAGDASADASEPVAEAETSGAPAAGDASAGASEPVAEAETSGAPAAGDASAGASEPVAEAE
ncbi:hypothetical protein IJT17_04200, partial [bacterium]|nr:hypothetical protein [bacterium]